MLVKGSWVWGVGMGVLRADSSPEKSIGLGPTPHLKKFKPKIVGLG